MRVLDNLERLIELQEVNRFTTTLSNRNENSAEHSWMVAIISLYLRNELTKEFPKLSFDKMLKMLLIHDIVEIETGDTPFFNRKAREKKQEKEYAAAKHIFKEQWNDEELYGLWLEFEEVKTLEAKVAKAIDRFSGFFQRYSSGQGWHTDQKSEKDIRNLVFVHFEFSKTLSEIAEEIVKLANKKNMFYFK